MYLAVAIKKHPLAILKTALALAETNATIERNPEGKDELLSLPFTARR